MADQPTTLTIVAGANLHGHYSCGKGWLNFVVPSGYITGGNITIKATAALVGAPGFSYNAAQCWISAILAQVNGGVVNSLVNPLATAGFSYFPGTPILTYGTFIPSGNSDGIYYPAEYMITDTFAEYDIVISGRNASGNTGTGGCIVQDNNTIVPADPVDNTGIVICKGVDSSGTVLLAGNMMIGPMCGAINSPYLIAPASTFLAAGEQVSLMLFMSSLGTMGNEIYPCISKLTIAAAGAAPFDLNLENGYVGFNNGASPLAFSPEVPLSFDPQSYQPVGFPTASNLYLIGTPAPPSNPMTPQGARIPLPKPYYAENKRLIFYPWDTAGVSRPRPLS